MKTVWCEIMHNRSRRPFLLLVSELGILRFKGSSIEGVASVREIDFVKNGNRTGSTYEIETPDSVLPLPGVPDFNLYRPFQGNFWNEVYDDFVSECRKKHLDILMADQGKGLSYDESNNLWKKLKEDLNTPIPSFKIFERDFRELFSKNVTAS